MNDPARISLRHENPPPESHRAENAIIPATAIILAGGKSLRMRCDKSLLPLGGVPIIEHVFRSLEACFEEVIINANDTAKYAFLRARIVSDKSSDQGPLAGILVALEAARHELSFVTACDIPEMPLALIRHLFDEAPGYDAVVPRSAGLRLEPLFAVYRKTMIPVFRTMFDSGGRCIRHAFERCAVKYIDVGEDACPKNINTPEDYAEFVLGDEEL